MILYNKRENVKPHTTRQAQRDRGNYEYMYKLLEEFFLCARCWFLCYWDCFRVYYTMISRFQILFQVDLNMDLDLVGKK